MDFSHNFHITRDQEYMTTIKGLTIKINEASINNVSSLPLGIPWEKEERQEAINAKKTFFLHNEKPDEDKKGKPPSPMVGGNILHHQIHYL
jgi:hypothetical protein